MKKNDLILAVLVVIAAITIFWGMNLFSQKGDSVVIHYHGEEFAVLPLDADDEISIDGKNSVKIEDGEAYVCYASCPDKLCMKQGRLKAEGKTLVCLPNQITVKIEKREK